MGGTRQWLSIMPRRSADLSLPARKYQGVRVLVRRSVPRRHLLLMAGARPLLCVAPAPPTQCASSHQVAVRLQGATIERRKLPHMVSTLL